MGNLNSNEAAIWLGLKDSTLAAWRMKGIGPRYFKFRGVVRYRLQDLESFLAARMKTPSTEPEVE